MQAPAPEDDRIAALLRAATLVDPADAALLRAAADELAALRQHRALQDPQMTELFETITAYAALEYDRRITVSDDSDDIVNAMAIGLNMMGEELSHTMRAWSPRATRPWPPAGPRAPSWPTSATSCARR